MTQHFICQRTLVKAYATMWWCAGILRWRLLWCLPWSRPECRPLPVSGQWQQRHGATAVVDWPGCKCIRQAGEHSQESLSSMQILLGIATDRCPGVKPSLSITAHIDLPCRRKPAYIGLQGCPAKLTAGAAAGAVHWIFQWWRIRAAVRHLGRRPVASGACSSRDLGRACSEQSISAFEGF